MSIPRTEMRNPDSTHMDKMSTAEMARLIIRSNYDAVRAVEDATDSIVIAIEAIANAFENGNRLFYVGAGTSGRLGVLDASECPPTFGVPRDTVQGIIAGGKERMFQAAEGEEDSYSGGVCAITDSQVKEGDIVCGISAAGNAAFVVGALEEAKRRGAITVAISSNPDTKILLTADIPIYTDTGAEVLTGSTRLKAGTAQKIVLNTITTCAMTKTGKVYENMMINLSPSNEKLRLRVIRIVKDILSCDEEKAIGLLEANEWSIRKAINSEKENELCIRAK